MKYRKLSLAFAAWLFCFAAAHAEIFKEVEDKETDGKHLYEACLTLHPAPEMVPAMKYRLLTEPAYLVNRDANIHYLKAGGFFLSFGAQKELRKKYNETEKYEESENPKERCKYIGNWCGADPDDLPLEEVKKTLKLLGFQEQELEEAAKCRFADFGHKDVFAMEDPFRYLLPEVQSMRELARWQAVRCKVAIREGRLDDAIEILRQQYMMSMHLEQDVFIVSYLVGIAIGGIADEDLLYLIQEPNCPSLYWALAAIPRPMSDPQLTTFSEKRMCSSYFPYHEKLRDPNSHFSEEFWPMYADEFTQKTLSALFAYHGPPSSGNKKIAKRSRAATTAYVILAYPKAKRYLIEDLKLDRQKVESFPPVRVVAMATSFAFEDLFDLNAKATLLPPQQSMALRGEIDRKNKDSLKRIGLLAALPNTFACAFLAYHNAVIRQEQNFNISQTLEALRIHAYNHDGKLPESLENMYPPAMKDPFTGKHFPYRLEDGKAILDTVCIPGYHRRLIIEMKPIPKK